MVLPRFACSCVYTPSHTDLVGGCACTVEWSTRIAAKGISANTAILTFMDPLWKETGCQLYRVRTALASPYGQAVVTARLQPTRKSIPMACKQRAAPVAARCPRSVQLFGHQPSALSFTPLRLTAES